MFTNTSTANMTRKGASLTIPRCIISFPTFTVHWSYARDQQIRCANLINTKNLKTALFTYTSASIIINFFLAFRTKTGVRSLSLGKVECPISANKFGINKIVVDGKSVDMKLDAACASRGL